MTERFLSQGNITNPDELSRQLLKCLRNIPQNNADDGFVRSSFCDPETFKRRGASEHKRFLCDKVRGILDQAPVTTSYKAEVMGQFENLYVLGVNGKGEAFSHTGSELRDFESLVGCDFDGNMAIFFEDGGRQERTAFIKIFAGYLQMLSDIYEYYPDRFLDTKERLMQWREELAVKYKRSPVPHHIYDILEDRKIP